MIKGQKSVRGGIEDFLCPFTDMFMTCGANESKYHMGTMAVDVRGVIAGVRYDVYAPATSKAIWVIPSNGQVMWQTVEPVRTSDGDISYVTYVTCHDDVDFNAYEGMVISQGEKIANMGRAGDTTGVHTHFEAAKGQLGRGDWKQNKYGNWSFANETDVEDLWFMDNTNIINGIGNWKYLKDVEVGEAVDQILHKGSHVQIPGTFEVIDINVEENTALVRIDGKDYWLSSIPLLEVK